MSFSVGEWEGGAATEKEEEEEGQSEMPMAAVC